MRGEIWEVNTLHGWGGMPPFVYTQSMHSQRRYELMPYFFSLAMPSCSSSCRHGDDGIERLGEAQAEKASPRRGSVVDTVEERRRQAAEDRRSDATSMGATRAGPGSWMPNPGVV